MPHLWQSGSGANILEVRGMEANADLSMLFSLNTNTLIAKNHKLYYQNIYTICIENAIFCWKIETLTSLSDLSNILFFKNILHALFLFPIEPLEGVSR